MSSTDADEAAAGGPAGAAGERLSPWPVRLVVYALLAAMALAAIRVIDRRAMITMHREAVRRGHAAPAD